MYCYHTREERNCDGTCHRCPYGFEFALDKNADFKYQCPKCSGKFNEKGCNGLSYYCPFCGLEMKGL